MDRQLLIKRQMHFQWKTWLQNGLLLVAAGFVAALIYSRWNELRSYEWQLRPTWLAFSLLIILCAWSVEVAVWRHLVQMLSGKPFFYRHALRIWFLTMLVRYVPGNVWQPLSVALHGQRHGVRSEAMVASVAMYQAVSVLAALPITAIYVAQYAITGAPVTYSPQLVWLLIVALLVPLFFLLLNPNWLTILANWGLRLLKRPPLEMQLTRRGLLLCVGGTVGSWLLWGAAFATMIPGVLALDSLPLSNFPLLPGLIYLYPIAHAAGMASLLTPTGLGVREGVFTVLAAPLLGSSAALIAVLAMRLWTTLAEVLMAGLVYLGMADV